MEFDLENPLSDTQSPFNVESDHLLPPQYVKTLKLRDSNFTIRRETISLITKLCHNSEPMLPYLAINYLDRFLSSQILPKPINPWIHRLLAVSCFSLAAKMQKTEYSVSPLFFQIEGGIDAETVQRMEMLILGALQWRMRSITPLAFLPFFITLFKIEDPRSMMALRARVREIIVKSQTDIEVLGFNPSVVAAAAVLYAAQDLLPFQFLSFHGGVCDCSYVNKEEILRCSNAIQKVLMEGRYEFRVDGISSSDSSITVLDLHSCSSADSVDSERLLKRRRMDELILNNTTVQIHN